MLASWQVDRWARGRQTSEVARTGGLEGGRETIRVRGRVRVRGRRGRR